MKSYEEKIAILQNFSKEISDAKGDMYAAAFGGSIAQTTTIMKVAKAYTPVMNMYSEGLNEAINPTNHQAVPALIMVLRQVLQGIIKSNPEAAAIADILMPLFPGEVEQTSLDGAFKFHRGGVQV